MDAQEIPECPKMVAKGYSKTFKLCPPILAILPIPLMHPILPIHPIFPILSILPILAIFPPILEASKHLSGDGGMRGAIEPDLAGERKAQFGSNVTM